jgi:hypothetical protein
MNLTRALLFLSVLFSPAALPGQGAFLSGRISDQSGAMVPGAAVGLRGDGVARSVIADLQGAYSFAGLATGRYAVSASAPQLTSPKAVVISLRAGNNVLNLQLNIVAATERLTVTDDNGPSVSTEASSNASATIIAGKDLDALSDDPEDLQADLEALAGPSAGPSGNAIFVDGFSGGQLPPKESIREIRINSNPFSPEYDKLGYGRIEIFTKPGSDKFHGTATYNLGTDLWNSRNPYAGVKAPFLLQETENSFSGPLGKRASFTFDVERQTVDNGSVSNGFTLNSAMLATPFSSVLKSPQRHWLLGPHVDYRINDNNTLTLRYLFTRGAIGDAGIGSFDQNSRGSHVVTLFNTGQIGETSIHGTVVNETRFQYFRRAFSTDANQVAPEIQVSGSFNRGGASTSHGSDTQNSYEFQNYTSVVHGAHLFRFGVRVREQTEDSVSPLNFNGTFTFSGGLAPELDISNQPLLNASGQPVMITINSIEQYRRTLLFQSLNYSPSLIRALGGGATQFSIATGNPALSVNQFDIAPFFDDDWKIRPTLTLSLGIRYEAQTNMRDRADVAPRVAVAWAPWAKVGTVAKTVLRAGVGMFYDRFALLNTLTAARYNGVVQQQYVVNNPDFCPSIPALSALAGLQSVQTIERVDGNLRAPSILQSALTLERQLPRNNTLALTYTNSHGLHIFRSAVIPSATSPVFLMKSDGLYNQNQFIANVNSKLNPAVSLFGYYVLNHAMSNTDGIGTFPANPYSSAGEYGRAATDIRNRVLVGGTINLRRDIRLNPLFTAQSGAPFNITTGEDNYGTTLFTSRPGIAANPSRPGLVPTPYGLLDPNPIAGEALLARNAGQGPPLIAFNLRLSKTWGFGPERGGGGAARSSRDSGPSAGPALAAPQGNRGLFTQPSTPRRYNLTVAMSGRNLLNHTNPAPIVGNIGSPLFGRSNQIAGTPNGEGFLETASNRRLELQIRFTY